MICNTTSLAMMSAQIAALNEEKQEMVEATKSIESEKIRSIIKMSIEMSASVTKNEMEIEVLERSNSTLTAEITQLELQYLQELDTSKNVEMIAEMVLKTIESIEFEFQACKREYPDHYHSDKVSEFVALREKVIEFASIKIEDSAKLDEVKNEEIVVSEKTIATFSPLDLSSIDLIYRGEVKELVNKYEILENRISPLRLKNQELIFQKEKIVKLQKENFKKLKLNSPVPKILAEVKATFEKVVWEQLAKVNQGAFPSNEWSPTGAKQMSDMDQKQMNKHIDSGKNQMGSLIETLETYEKMNQGSK